MCGCGGGPESGIHPISENGCYRKVATGNLVPTNFRYDAGFKANVCDVNGYTITEYTLLSQRLYHKHEDGNWSLPKDEGTMISLGEEW